MTTTTAPTDGLGPLERLIDGAQMASVALAIREQVIEERMLTGLVRNECSGSIAIVDHACAGEAAYLQTST